MTSEISEMQELVSLVIDGPEISVRDKTSEVTISLRLRDTDLTSTKYPISGFPRALMAEDRLVCKYILSGQQSTSFDLLQATTTNLLGGTGYTGDAAEELDAWPSHMETHGIILAELSRVHNPHELSICR